MNATETAAAAGRAHDAAGTAHFEAGDYAAALADFDAGEAACPVHPSGVVTWGELRECVRQLQAATAARRPITDAKTPETLTTAARRALACEPRQHPLSGDAHLVLATITAMISAGAGVEPFGPWGQRYVRILAVRDALPALPAYRFNRAMAQLAGEHRVGLHWPADTTAAEDAASVLHQGNSYHAVTSDPWRSAVAEATRTGRTLTTAEAAAVLTGARPAEWLRRATAADPGALPAAGGEL